MCGNPQKVCIFSCNNFTFYENFISVVVERFQQTKTNAEPIVTENPSNEETMNAFEQLTVSGGAVGKFKKAEKKKKNKKKHKF